METRRARSELIPHLKESKSRGHGAFMNEDMLMVNGRIYDMDYLRRYVVRNQKSQYGHPYKDKIGRHTGHELADDRKRREGKQRVEGNEGR